MVSGSLPDSLELASAVGSREETEAIMEEESDVGYVRGLQLFTLMSFLLTGQFIMSLDSTVITTALPHITTDFHGLDDVGWYGSAYLLLTTATQPLWGKIYTYFNIKYSFFVAIVIFELGSIICAVATSSTTFIIGRAVAGVGQAALLAGGTFIIVYRIPIQKRPLIFAVMQSVGGVASILGPPLGGVFTDSEKLTWRFCFWINVPIGGLLILAGLLFFQNPKRASSRFELREKLVNLDIPGTVLFLFSLTCLFTGLQLGGSIYSWSDVRAWGWIIGASIPRRLLAQRNVAFGCIYTCFIAAGFIVQTYYLPFYFQSAKGSSAEQAGFYMIPYLIASVLVAGVVGIMAFYVGALLPFMVIGAAVFAIGSGLLSTLQPNSSTASWAGFEVLAAIGFGSTVQFALVAIQASIPKDDIAIGNGLFLLSNFGGMALGISCAEAIFLNLLNQQLRTRLPQSDVDAVISAGATAISTAVSPSLVGFVIDAYNFAITRVLLFSAVTASLGLFGACAMKWVDVKKRG